VLEKTSQAGCLENLYQCHSEPFGKLRTGSAKKETLCHPEPFDRLRINSAKDLEILRRPAVGGTPQNDVFGDFFSIL